MPSADETVFRGPRHDRIHDEMLARLRRLEDPAGARIERKPLYKKE